MSSSSVFSLYLGYVQLCINASLIKRGKNNTDEDFQGHDDTSTEKYRYWETAQVVWVRYSLSSWIQAPAVAPFRYKEGYIIKGWIKTLFKVSSLLLDQLCELKLTMCLVWLCQCLCGCIKDENISTTAPLHTQDTLGEIGLMLQALICLLPYFTPLLHPPRAPLSK